MVPPFKSTIIFMSLRAPILLIALLFCQTSFSQTKNDTINTLEIQAKNYLTEMYVNRNFDVASKFLDSRVFTEMEDFYVKRNQGQLKDSVLYYRIKFDISKYYKILTQFRFDKFLQANIEREDNFTFGYIFFEYTEFLKSSSETIKSMLVFISEDKGKNWLLQDWKIKDIADKVEKGIIK